MTGRALIFFLISQGSLAACLPDSPGLLDHKSNFEMRAMEDSVQKFESSMVRDLPADHELIIRLDPHNPRINAEIVKVDKFVTISVWGGMLMHPRMSGTSMMLLLCHELGHFLGGPPLKSRNGWSSTEGQADYFSAINCVKQLGVDEGQFSEAALALTSIYAEVTKQEIPRLDRCDMTVVNRINYGYPNVQCRLDTLMAGWRELPRPACWYFE